MKYYSLFSMKNKTSVCRLLNFHEGDKDELMLFRISVYILRNSKRLEGKQSQEKKITLSQAIHNSISQNLLISTTVKVYGQLPIFISYEKQNTLRIT